MAGRFLTGVVVGLAADDDGVPRGRFVLATCLGVAAGFRFTVLKKGTVDEKNSSIMLALYSIGCLIPTAM